LSSQTTGAPGQTGRPQAGRPAPEQPLHPTRPGPAAQTGQTGRPRRRHRPAPPGHAKTRPGRKKVGGFPPPAGLNRPQRLEKQDTPRTPRANRDPTNRKRAPDSCRRACRDHLIARIPRQTPRCPTVPIAGLMHGTPKRRMARNVTGFV